MLHFAVENRIIDGVGGFGFTRALIFPYDELDFLPFKCVGWMRTLSVPAPVGQKCSISWKILCSTRRDASYAAGMH